MTSRRIYYRYPCIRLERRRKYDVLIQYIPKIIPLITFFLASLTVYFAWDSVNWYRNPEPLLLTWSSAEGVKDYFDVPTNSHYDPEKGVTSLSKSYTVRKITFWLHNAGRKPVTGIYISNISFYNLSGNTYNYPFRIFAISTGADALYFSNGSIFWNGKIASFYNSFNVSDFLPNDRHNSIPSLSIPPVGPDETVNFTIELFSIEEDVYGTLKVELKDSTGKVYQFSPITLRSIEGI